MEGGQCDQRLWHSILFRSPARLLYLEELLSVQSSLVRVLGPTEETALARSLSAVCTVLHSTALHCSALLAFVGVGAERLEAGSPTREEDEQIDRGVGGQA